jgi:Fe-S cluster biosynthesis and repair protein YggX
MYIQVIDNKLTAWGAYPFDEYTKEVPSVDYDDYTSNPGKYIFQNNTIVKNPNWEEEQELKEKERVARLNMTKLDFVTYIDEYGVTYEQIKQLLASNENAQKQWELCERVYRFNPLLDSLASALNITPAQLDTMFKKANGEVV